MAIKYFIKAKTSEYTDKEGSSKNRYSTIGTVVETKKGDLMLILETLPLFAMKEGKLMAYLNIPEEVSAEPKKSAQNLSNLDEDVPF
jgi:hypothetical protein